MGIAATRQHPPIVCSLIIALSFKTVDYPSILPTANAFVGATIRLRLTLPDARELLASTQADGCHASLPIAGGRGG